MAESHNNAKTKVGIHGSHVAVINIWLIYLNEP